MTRRLFAAVVVALVSFGFAGPADDPATSPQDRTRAPDPTVRFLAEVNRAYRIVWFIESKRPRPPASTTTTTAPARALEDPDPEPEPDVVEETGSGSCGGSLPDCSIMQCESGGDIRAENPNSSASGKWQIIDGTWAGFGGYARASDAPESVQDERAAQLWNSGAGASHWEQCR